MGKNFTKLEVKGIKGLKKALKYLPEQVRGKANASAIRFAANPIVKEAKAKAPRESGTLAESMGQKVKKYEAGYIAVSIIGPKTNSESVYKGKKRIPAFYAHLVEHGYIKPDGTKVAANPFLRPSFESKKGEALKRYQKKIWKAIKKAAAKAKTFTK